MTSSDRDSAATQEHDPHEDLPSFLREPDRIDKILYASLMAMAVYGFALIPFRAVLLLEHTFLHTWLSGSNLSVLILAAKNPDRPWFLAFVVLVAALSTIKFMPLFYWMGKKWGPEFITMSFGGYPPRWFRKMEAFIYRRIDVSLFASFVPFSPIPATIVVGIGGIARAKGWLVGAYLFIFAVMLKCFYLYLGLTFGPSIQSSLETIDKYVMYITFALIGWMFLSIWWKNSKKAKVGAGDGAEA
ncbi:hypothetical protein [Corynebacterium lactis]|uniref:Membrane protein n=1 Tax=Corynebacterium lactis RW2-5 TaxID=1408189 RepID=A0A0K2H1S6_9CORY|nr:hypothetical protein [Corynebacterium lactis]ALA68000.1 membrane protein [Corynebacterium lactis RW2-5]